MRISATTVRPPVGPHTSMLRHRAHDLRALAVVLERLQVHRVADDPSAARTRGPLATALLEHNVLQLLDAAEQLRDAAWRLTGLADELDLASTVPGRR